MKHIKKVILSFIIFMFVAIGQANATTMAFGYLSNTTNDESYNYLEVIFPNSFANSIENIFDVNIIKPLAIKKRLKRFKIKLKKNYKPFELPELTDRIKTDLFIYGTFTPLPDNQIKIVLNLYSRDSNKIFTFTNVGKMETEIFKLVDRITQVLLNFMDYQTYYQNAVLKPGSNIGIITNISGQELNSLYSEFMKKGYKISAIQGNSLNNEVNNNIIEKFKYIKTDENSFDMITDPRQIKFLLGTWSNKFYLKQLNDYRKIYRKYDLHYQTTKNNILTKLEQAYKGQINGLLIIGFNKTKRIAWVRCINLKEKNLILMKSNIRGNSIEDVANKIIKRLSKMDKKILNKK